jgi:transcriptional regulator with XRE-family HTH domain
MPRATRPGGLPHPLNQHVGARLQQRRQMLGMSRREFGLKAGMAPQQVQKYERGINALSAHRLYQFAALLGVRVGFFFKGLKRAPAVPSGKREKTRRPAPSHPPEESGAAAG